MFLTLLSPAKTQTLTDVYPTVDTTLPPFRTHARQLITTMENASVTDLQKLLSVSERIAADVHDKIAHFSPRFTNKNSAPALWFYAGDAYQEIATGEYNKDDILFAQKNLRILSGLYGIVRPLDRLQPYRLEMNTAINPPSSAQNLYEFWGERITQFLNKDIKTLRAKAVIDLSSNQYGKVVDSEKLTAPRITVVFKEEKDGETKTVAIHAKRARGMMTDYIIQNRIKKPEKLKDFARQGYRFRAQLSSENEWVFVRKHT